MSDPTTSSFMRNGGRSLEELKPALSIEGIVGQTPRLCQGVSYLEQLVDIISMC